MARRRRRRSRTRQRSTLFKKLLSVLGVRKASQRARVKSASKLIEELADPSHSDGYRFGIIRNTDPFVIEEAILTAYNRAGHPIRRNKRYTGDGGIDGWVKLDRHWHAVQAKRYSSSINPAHVDDFAEVCRRRRCRGVFVHFGRTGPKSLSAFRRHADLVRVSGQDALDLLVHASRRRR